jgi:hypothetical protein
MKGEIQMKKAKKVLAIALVVVAMALTVIKPFGNEEEPPTTGRIIPIMTQK